MYQFSPIRPSHLNQCPYQEYQIVAILLCRLGKISHKGCAPNRKIGFLNMLRSDTGLVLSSLIRVFFSSVRSEIRPLLFLYYFVAICNYSVKCREFVGRFHCLTTIYYSFCNFVTSHYKIDFINNNNHKIILSLNSGYNPNIFQQ